jgi:hypothetical protein
MLEWLKAIRAHGGIASYAGDEDEVREKAKELGLVVRVVL